MSRRAKSGVLGRSGLYRMSRLDHDREHSLTTPFGAAGDTAILPNLSTAVVAFRSQHRRERRLMPTEISYLADVYALESLGVEDVIGVSACSDTLSMAPVSDPARVPEATEDTRALLTTSEHVS